MKRTRLAVTVAAAAIAASLLTAHAPAEVPVAVSAAAPAEVHVAVPVAVLAAAPAGQLAAGVPTAAAHSTQPNGRMIFERKGNCATCHGRNGKGTPLAPDLTDDEWLNIGGSLEQVAAVVRSGVPDPVRYPAPMPPMGGARLSGEEIEAVAAYVVSLRPKRDAGS